MLGNAARKHLNSRSNGSVAIYTCSLCRLSHRYEVGSLTHWFFGLHVQYDVGAIAVSLFYMLSGYDREEKFEGLGRRALTFYVDRIWPLYPAYLVSFSLALAYMRYAWRGRRSRPPVLYQMRWSYRQGFIRASARRCGVFSKGFGEHQQSSG